MVDLFMRFGGRAGVKVGRLQLGVSLQKNSRMKLKKFWIKGDMSIFEI